MAAPFAKHKVITALDVESFALYESFNGPWPNKPADLTQLAVFGKLKVVINGGQFEIVDDSRSGSSIGLFALGLVFLTLLTGVIYFVVRNNDETSVETSTEAVPESVEVSDLASESSAVDADDDAATVGESAAKKDRSDGLTDYDEAAQAVQESTTGEVKQTTETTSVTETTTVETTAKGTTTTTRKKRGKNTVTSLPAKVVYEVTTSTASVTTHSHDDHEEKVTTSTIAGVVKPTSFANIMTFGMFHTSSDHTHDDSLLGGRTPITTEAYVSYLSLRDFLGLADVDLETIGKWAFANDLTNNAVPYEQDLDGVGLYVAMQAAKVGWMEDAKFDSQVVADFQRTARLGSVDEVLAIVETYGRDGYAHYLEANDLVDVFVSTLKMEPHYGGWMHARMHGDRPFYSATGEAVATAHDLHHLTVLSHDQTEPFMNDTFDWPQWPALDVPEGDVLNYFQSMINLGDPNGTGI